MSHNERGHLTKPVESDGKPHTEPSVIRIWAESAEPLDYLIEYFRFGFSVPRDHPATEFLWSDEFQACALTVESTEQFMWKPYEVARTPNGGTEVFCEPYITGFRDATVPDWMFLEMERKKPGLEKPL